jgi:quinol monooxygenase YgiN
MLYEPFRSQAAIDSHFAPEHFATISTAVAHLAEGGKPKITYFHALTD